MLLYNITNLLAYMKYHNFFFKYKVLHIFCDTKIKIKYFSDNEKVFIKVLLTIG